MRTIKYLMLLFLPLAFVACGGGSEDKKPEDITPQKKIIQGVVYDDVIVNLPYKTKGFNLKTDENGKFSYEEGEVKFYLNNLFIGKVSKMPEDKRVFLTDMLSLERGDFKNQTLLKLARILQSLDSTPSSDGKIVLDEKILQNVKMQKVLNVKNLVDVDLESFKNILKDDFGKSMVLEEDAIKHLVKTYDEQQIPHETNEKPKPKPLPKPQPKPKPKQDLTKPFIKTISIPNDSKNIPVDVNISIVFSEKIKKENISSQIILNKQDTNDTIALNISSDDNKTFTVTPKAKLDEITNYILTIKGIQDLFGNILKDVNITTFKTEDKTSPITKEISIKNGDTNVKLDANFTISFSEKIDLNGIKNGIILNKKGSSEKVEYTTISDDNKNLIIKPNNNLLDLTEYVLTIKDIQDLSGNILEEVKTINFTTEDKTPPVIVENSLKDGDMSVPTDLHVKLVFSEKIKTENISSQIILNKQDTNDTIALNISSDDNKTFTITPKAKLDEITNYILTIKDIKDLWDNVLQEDKVITFTTADETKPKVNSFIVHGGDTNTPVDTNITVTFSEKIDKDSIKKGITLLIQSKMVDFFISTDDNQTFIIKPSKDLLYGKEYNLIFDGIEDLSGNLINKSTQTFKTIRKRIYVSQEGDGANYGEDWENTYSDIQQAIMDASKTLTKEIWVKKGTYEPTQTLELHENVKFYGGFDGNETDISQRDLDANPTVLDGNNNISILKANNVKNVLIDGFTLTKGKATESLHGGAFSSNASDINMSNMIFMENSTSQESSAGAMNIGRNSVIRITNSVFSKNVSNGSFSSGAVYIEDKSKLVHMDHLTFNKNKIVEEVDYGSGAIMVEGTTNLDINNSTFNKNIAKGVYVGGAIYIYGEKDDAKTNVNVYNTTFNENSTSVNNNAASHNAGAIFTNNGINVYNCAFNKNSVKGGYGDAGAICSRFKTTNISNSTFNENSANGDYSGSVFYFSQATIDITNSTFSANIANSDNDDSFRGSLIFISGENSINISNSTFSENRISGNNDNICLIGLIDSNNVFKVINTVLWDNQAATICDWNGNMQNVLSNISYSVMENANTANNNLSQDPFLTKKTKNINGVNHIYYDLQNESPAINMGNNDVVTTQKDQIGNQRIQGGIVDIGAIEKE